MKYLLEGFVAHIRQAMERALEEENDVRGDESRSNAWTKTSLFFQHITDEDIVLYSQSSMAAASLCIKVEIKLTHVCSSTHRSIHVALSRMGIHRLSRREHTLHSTDQTNEYDLRTMPTLCSTHSTEAIGAWLFYRFGANAFVQRVEKSQSTIERVSPPERLALLAVHVSQ